MSQGHETGHTSETDYLSARRIQSQNRPDPPVRVPQRLSVHRVQGAECWKQRCLDGSSAAFQPFSSVWGLGAVNIRPTEERSLLANYPRGSEEVPYKQKNILKINENKTVGRKKVKARRRRRVEEAEELCSNREHGSGSSIIASGTGATISNDPDKDEVTWSHFRDVKELDWKEHWQSRNPSAPAKEAVQAWTHKQDNIYLARHQPSLTSIPESHQELQCFNKMEVDRKEVVKFHVGHVPNC